MADHWRQAPQFVAGGCLVKTNLALPLLLVHLLFLLLLLLPLLLGKLFILVVLLFFLLRLLFFSG
jgi:hypothetical protein